MPNLSLPISSVHVTNNPHLILLDEGNVEVVGRLRLPLLLAAKVPDDLLNVPRLDLHGEPRPLLALLAPRDASVVHGEEGPLEVAPRHMIVDTDLPAYIDTLATIRKCQCKQISAYSDSDTLKGYQTCKNCHCNTVSGEIYAKLDMTTG